MEETDSGGKASPKSDSGMLSTKVAQGSDPIIHARLTARVVRRVWHGWLFAYRRQRERHYSEAFEVFPEGDKRRLLGRVAVILPEQHRLEIFGDRKLKEKVGCEAKDLQTALM